MKRALLITLKIAGSLILLLLIALGAGAMLLNSASFQNRIQRKFTTLLSERLGTKVGIDSVSVDIWKGGVSLYHLNLLDQKGMQLLQVDTAQVALDLWKLTLREVEIEKAQLLGSRINLYKIEPDTVSNFQFILDSLKRKPTAQQAKPKEKKKKEPLNFDIHSVTIRRIELQYENKRTVKTAFTRSESMRKQKGSKRWRQLDALPKEETRWMMQKVRLDELLYRKGTFAKHGKGKLTIKGLHYWNDNGEPRKNTGKKNRGWFDPKHMDTDINMEVALHYAEGDSLALDITDMNVLDSIAGIELTDLKLKASMKGGMAWVKDFSVKQQQNTTLEFDSATIILPSKKKGIGFSFRTSQIRGKTLLKDISRPFAPVLKGFQLPLELKVQMAGTDSTVFFNDIHVYTPDSLFRVTATGDIAGLKNKYDLNVHFKVTDMQAKGKIKRRIIDQFPVKKFMMTQLDQLGTIRYTGNINVFWRKERFDGLLRTAVGPLNFNFYIDEIEKYVIGTVSSRALRLADIAQMKDLGDIDCNINFTFDISKPRTAQMRKKVGGKLPMGKVDAKVNEARYKKISLKNVEANIVSNGAIAEGNVVMKGKRMDGLCRFSFTNTDSISKMKIKPGIRFHKMSDEDKATRDQEKAEKKAAKEKEEAERKAAKAKEKAEKKAAKEKAKSEKKAAKEKAKAEKAKAAAEEAVQAEKQ